MFKCPHSLITISVAGLIAASYGGEFTLKKADHDLLLKRRVFAWEMSAGALQNLRPEAKLKVTEGLVEPKVKYFYSEAGKPCQLLVFKSSKEAKTFDRVIVDQAANRDFTDDPVLTIGPDLPAECKLQLKGQEAADYRIYLVTMPKAESAGDVALLPVLWREGTVMLAGKPVRAVMQRAWSRQTLIMDCDGDGQLDRDWYQVSTYMKIKDAFYKAVPGASAYHLDLEPYEGPFGKLELTGEMVPKGDHVMISLVLGGGVAEPNKPPFDYAVQEALTNQPVRVPVGSYGIPYGYVIEQGKSSKYINFSVAEGIVIQPDHVTTLNLGPAKEDLSIVQRDRTLTVNRVKAFTGVQVVTYGMIPGESRAPALSIDVVDAADPTKVIVGRTNMEYG